MMSFEVSIKDPRGQSLLVRVNPGMTVLQVRQEFSRRSQLDIDRFKLVFAGQTLPDGARLEVLYLTSIYCTGTAEQPRIFMRNTNLLTLK